MSSPNLVSPQVINEPGLSQEGHPRIPVSEETILKQEKKERPLVLDPIIISYFGEFRNDMKSVLSSLCTAGHGIGQSKQRGGPGG